MNVSSKQLIALGGGLLWTLAAITSARAQDIELFVGNAASATTARPNILLILDDSGSMGGEVTTQLSYDPATTYASQGCDTNRVYWSTNGSPPPCATDQWFDRSALVCQRALDTFAVRFGGSYTDNFAQYDDGVQVRWEGLDPTQKSRLVECQDDRPDSLSGWTGHGDGSNATLVYATNGDPSYKWTSAFNQEIGWGQPPVENIYSIYDGNYMNWFYGPPVTTTRIEVMKDVASSLVTSINGVNFGLMSFNRDQGGTVRKALEDVSTSRAEMLDAIDGLRAANYTPLSETLFEAYEYLSGGSVVYGNGGDSAAIGNNSTYNSPINLACQKTHIVLLTDGEPRRDLDATSRILGLSDSNGDGFSDLVGGTCDLETYPASLSPEGGECLDDLAEYMQTADLSPLAGQQNVTTHTVGFLIDLEVLNDTASRGGGEYRQAQDTASLTSALTNIITSILETSATFTAPSVSINSFNQTRNLDSIYISVFKPSGTSHWPGNLKKYRLRASDATIVDALDNPAIDPATGFFSDTAQSFWSVAPDGAEIEDGGAAHMIPAAREVYTNLVSPDLNAVGNRISALNGNLTNALLNTGAANQPSLTDVVNFINGLDASDVDQDGDVTELRNQMGDPLHSQPVSVVYGPTSDDARIYFATNDGFLHSIDATTGVEQWAFLPNDFLDNQVEFFKDNSVTVGQKYYGIDGSLRVQMLADNDGIVEAANGEKVYLFFGMRRGGDFYYGLDVTNPDDPQLLWKLDSGDLPGLGQSWSNPVPTRINVGGVAQNPDRLVLVMGGGYDPSQDFNFTSTDAAGNSIYIVDSVTGNLLWHGTNSGGDKDFNTPGKSMDYSIPADIRVVDLNGDLFADRMYAADMGGQVWRFDIINGQPPATLVNGGVIAQLGAAGDPSPTLQNTRRFYYAPDIAIVNDNDYNYLHIGIGSGYRAHPTDTINQNRFYALRDYNPFQALQQIDYDGMTPVTDADLTDVTHDLTATVPQGDPGWKITLDDGGWRGEKVLSEARTFNNKIYVTTFRPGATGAGCQPALGTNRQYILDIHTGRPVVALSGVDDGTLDEDDRYTEWTGAPPPETVFIFADDPNCVGSQCPPVQCVDVNCGLTDFPNNPTRTFWREDNIEGN